jgi:hypothetical protein
MIIYTEIAESKAKEERDPPEKKMIISILKVILINYHAARPFLEH